jgi:prepilin-type N-terminal cleavage/methylation domain-containing protein/prepilin-type processing-associated H-X9-DG protein
MCKSRRAGFTLIELMVVIGIMALLAVLTVGGVVVGMQVARRYRCTANVKDLGLAAISYETSHNHYPTVVSPTGNWVQALFTGLDRADLAANPTKAVIVPQLFCPLNTPAKSKPGALDYVANGAVCRPDISTANVKFLQRTIMLGEKINTGLWTQTDPNVLGFMWDGKSETIAKANLFKSPHLPYFNVAFCDGHAEKISEESVLVGSSAVCFMLPVPQ